MRRLSECVAPSFYDVHRDIRDKKHDHYVLKGGRGSCKSSFVAVEIIMELLRTPDIHAVCLRKVADTLRDSVFAQLLWAIDILGVSQYFSIGVSPMRITYTPTGQMIYFRGCDDPLKLKSIKPPFGHFGILWFEEWAEFDGAEETRSVRQSIRRGSGRCIVFYSYNPPPSAGSWVNQEINTPQADRLVHHSTYLTVPPAWLGESFLAEAEHLRMVAPESWRHEYGGEVIGTGGEIFRNVTVRTIPEEELQQFDRIRRGIDWGYAADPFAYIGCHYDKTRRRLYIFDEIYKTALSNRVAAELLQSNALRMGEIIADSAEPKSIAEMWDYGIRCRGAVKGADSVRHGIKWLCALEAIVIDPVRCPNAAREFTSYELERDAHGGFKGRYPDKDNHTIDAVRYALEDDIRNVTVR